VAQWGRGRRRRRVDDSGAAWWWTLPPVVVAAEDPSDGSGMAPPGATRRSRWRRQARGLRDERQGISFQAGEGGGGGGRRTRVGAGSRRWILRLSEIFVRN
jgi:hypothetical protein